MKFFFALLCCYTCCLSADSLVFLHIPKTGGVTVMSQIANQLPNASDNQFRSLHMSLFDIKRQPWYRPMETNLVTFLRHPVDRVLSEHRHLITRCGGNPQNFKYHFLPTSGDPLDTANNEMCRLLSGLSMNNPAISLEQHLQEAKNNLHNFYFVGITERMKESIDLLFFLQGWPLPEEVFPFNTSLDDEQFSKETIAGIAERNWADIELYEYALALFTEELETISLHQTPTHVAASTRHVLLTMNQTLNGYGWAAKHDGVYSSKSVRWVDKRNKGSLDFSLDDSCNYSLQCTLYVHPTLLPLLSAAVNGIDIPFTASKICTSKLTDRAIPLTKELVQVDLCSVIPQQILLKDKPQRLLLSMLTPTEGSPEEQVFKRWINSAYFGNNCQRGHFAVQSIAITASEDTPLSLPKGNEP